MPAARRENLGEIVHRVFEQCHILVGSAAARELVKGSEGDVNVAIGGGGARETADGVVADAPECAKGLDANHRRLVLHAFRQDVARDRSRSGSRRPHREPPDLHVRVVRCTRQQPVVDRVRRVEAGERLDRQPPDAGIAAGIRCGKRPQLRDHGGRVGKQAPIEPHQVVERGGDAETIRHRLSRRDVHQHASGRADMFGR